MIDYESLKLISNDEIFKQFVYSTIDDFLQIRPITYNNFCNNIEWTEEAFQSALRVLKDVILKLARKDNDITDELEQLDASRRGTILSCFELRASQLYNFILLSKYSETERMVTDFDWRLKLVMCSAKYTTLIEPLLQIDFHTVHQNQKQVLPVEMNPTELRKLIDVLEKAKE